jgi:hypothetical protein
MLKIAVIGAQTLLGRELVRGLETRDCSVIPLATGPLSMGEEEGDLVVFAPSPLLLEGLDLVILTDSPKDETLLQGFPGRILDLREDLDPKSADPIPLGGLWPPTVLRYRGRPALEQVLATLPTLMGGLGFVAGTHLCSIASLGDRGLDGLLEQTLAVVQGEEPNTEKLGYRAAFEVIPQIPRGSLVEIRVPVFHGDILVLHLRAAEGQRLEKKEAPPGMVWTDTPPSSRAVAVTAELLAHLSLSEDAQSGVLTLGFDPILWGTLRPVMRLLGF